MECMNIVETYLKANGFDGLVSLEGECGCTLDDFNACGEAFNNCSPAYKWVDACKTCKHQCDGYDESGKNYCMRLKKQSTIPTRGIEQDWFDSAKNPS